MRRLVPDEAGLREAADALARGELVAFPTETVYGLGARADDARAVRRIYEAKGRPWQNPSIVHAGAADAAFALGRDVSEAARALAAHFWPGPLTLIVPVRAGAVAAEAVAGGATLALRVPAHPVARALLARCDFGVAAPSANRSNHVSPTTADHVARSLGERVEVILDGGAADVGLESTIVDTTTDPPMVLRLGMLAASTLAQVTPVRVAPARRAAENEAVPAPGNFARHYAPDVPLRIVEASALEALLAMAHGQHVRVVAPEGALVSGAAGAAASSLELLPPDPEGYARGLYDALHRADASGAELLVVVAPPREAAWAAIWDRLTRASERT